LFGTTAMTDERAVFTAAAGLTEMAGWMAHDAGRDALAEQHFQRALGMATVGQDHQLGGHILASLSHLAHHTKRPEQAITYARQGHDRLRAGHPHPGVESKLFAMQARGHAALGQYDPCREQLRHAERVLDRGIADPVSPWVSHFDEASLAAEAARCFQRLGKLDAARCQAEQVVELRPRERARSRAFAQLILISILIAQGRPDEACAVAFDVLDATRTLGSYLVVRQFEDLTERFAPYERQHARSPLAERSIYMTDGLLASNPAERLGDGRSRVAALSGGGFTRTGQRRPRPIRRGRRRSTPRRSAPPDDPVAGRG
jgi:hypothetical protein